MGRAIDRGCDLWPVSDGMPFSIIRRVFRRSKRKKKQELVLYRAAMDDWRATQKTQMELILSYKKEGLWEEMPAEAKAAMWEQEEKPKRQEFM